MTFISGLTASLRLAALKAQICTGTTSTNVISAG
jgi:hypothetical protein